MKKNWKAFAVLFLLLLGLLCCFRISAGSISGEKTGRGTEKTSASPAGKKTLAPSADMKIIARVVAYTTEHSHFRKEKIDGEISRNLFDDYFKMLDPGRNFFTEKDIRRFAPRRDRLAFDLASGDISFAFEVFSLYVERLRSYEKFVNAFLSSPVSLSSSETYVPNRSKLPYCADEKALEKLWRKRIVNDLILMKMADMAEKEEAEKNSSGKKEKKAEKKPSETGKKNDEPPPPPKKRTPEERLRKRVHQSVQYYSGMESQDVAEFFLTCFLQVYDPHSSYMSPRTQEDFDINMKLSLVGIGAVLTNEDGYTKIVKIIPGGPADKDGRLKAGDRIDGVTQENGEHTDLMDMPVSKVVNFIRGKEGTKVTLSVLEKGSTGARKSITLVRAEVKLKDSEASAKVRKTRDPSGKERRIGVITLPSFYIDFEAAFRGDREYKSSTRDVLRLLGDLSKEGPLDGLIIDLRGNGGGSLLEAVTLTGLFIPSGPVVQVRDPKNTKVDSDRDGGLVAYPGPLAVLTNRLSASSAEIFTGAIQDYRRGIVIGDRRTHGKGTVQTVSDLGKYTTFLGMGSAAGSLKLTNAKFYRINGESTQLRGVVPDIVLPSFSELMELGEDKLPHAMAWDKIGSVAYVPLRTGIPQCLPFLREQSEKRQEKDPDFVTLRRDMESYRKIRDKKEVVLDLQKRWKEYQAEKKLFEEQEKILKTDQDEEKGDPDKEKKGTDLYLKESLSIMCDYLSWCDRVHR
ncbi:MAG: carboxy terminal-processing peptidase, partial [Lentisphaeria bacterium]|nr:carboxy terminal-processing peptidase [Lentisphaeria bacterium]